VEPGRVQLENAGGYWSLLIDGKPWLGLAGEVGNSSSSCQRHMAPIWKRAKRLACNAVLAPVTWELLEPREGQYDFAQIDALIEGARSEGLRLIPLWFGTWKNAQSAYAPPWVRADRRRFFRAELHPGVPGAAVSAFCSEAQEADSRAFAALMEHVGQVDADHGTVVMVQVHNEVGLLQGEARDRCPQADAAFERSAPEALLTHLADCRGRLHPMLEEHLAGTKAGTRWADLFDDAVLAEEAFTAWHIGRFTNSVAAAGRREYALPMFANAWVVNFQTEQPGEYPAGGPVAHLHDIWRAAAPALSAFAADIYSTEHYAEHLRAFARIDQPLLIPEIRRSNALAAQALYCFGAHNALLFAPFGLEEIPMRRADRECHDAASASGEEALDRGSMAHGLAGAYDVLSQLTPLLVRHRPGGNVWAVLQQPAFRRSQGFVAGDLVFRLRFTKDCIPGGRHGVCLVIRVGPQQYLAAGIDCELRLIRRGGTLEFAWIEEGDLREGRWNPGRRLNGDEGGRITFSESPTICRFELLEPAAGVAATGENVTPFEPLS
jgi:hypothetical protein